MTAAVHVKGLSKAFGAVSAIEDLSFDVGANEFVSIVGPSGCGKSTALRIVAGLTDASGGRVEVQGSPVTKPVQGVGMVFQSPVLLPWRSMLSNVLFPAEMRGENPRKYRDRAIELIRLAGLAGFEQHRPYQLSGGMQQRAAICRSLLLEPSLLLMDEPFGALDIMTRERLGFELQKMWSATRNAVVFVTHSITEAVLLSDKVIVMTGRPGHAKAEISIPLPRPRLPETMKDPLFVELAAQVRDQIEAQWIE
jgi:NitT/TauT family transport system ATP-binding protein